VAWNRLRTQGIPKAFWELMGPLVMGSGIFLYYLITAPWVSADKDAAEFVLALNYGGVPHPTGYPLYILAGSPIVHLLTALGATPAYAAHVWSALGGWIAVVLVGLLSLSLCHMAEIRDRSTRLATTSAIMLLFGCNPMVHMEATLAEVYSWHLAWVGWTTVFWIAIIWFLHSPHSNGEEAPRLKLLAFIWGISCGIGGAHHVTALFVAAPYSIAIARVLYRRGQLTLALIGCVAAGVAIPLSSYFWIMWRATFPARFHWATLVPGWASWWEHITASLYRGLYVGKFEPSIVHRQFLMEYIYPYLIAGVAALAWFIYRSRPGTERTILVGLAAVLVLNLTYNFNYGVPDPTPYFLGCLLIVTPILVVAYVRVCDLVQGKVRLISVMVGLLIAGMAMPIWWHRVNGTRSEFFENVDRDLRALWMRIPEGPVIVFWPDDMVHKLMEYQLIGGEKIGANVIHTRMLANPAPRNKFVAQYGFDPIQLPPQASQPGWSVSDSAVIGDVADPEARKLGVVHANVNARTTVPVVMFDPGKGSVRMLKKPDIVVPNTD
jgi:hypothetical protein